MKAFPKWVSGFPAFDPSRNLVAVVGGVSSGAALFPEAHNPVISKDAFTILIEDREIPDPTLAKPKKDVDLVISWKAYRGNLQKLIQILKSLGGRITGILPGYEDVVPLTIELQNSGEFPDVPITADQVGPLQSKSDLGTVLQAHGLTERVDKVFDNPTYFEAWLNTFTIENGPNRELKHPLMFKPDNGASSVGSKKVQTVDQALSTFKHLIGMRVPNGTKTKSVHVSSFIEAPEFAVNFSKSYDPKTKKEIFKVSSLILILKEFHDGHPLYKSEFLLNPFDPQISEQLVRLLGPAAKNLNLLKLMEDIRIAANAVGFRNGPAHPEVFFSFDNRSELFDFAGRLMGGGRSDWVARASAQRLGDAHFGMASILNSKYFASLPDFNTPAAHAAVVFLRTTTGGSMSRSARAALSRLIQSGEIKSQLKLKVKPVGKSVEPTTDLINYPGCIELVLNKDKGSFDDLLSDMEKIENLLWIDER